MIPDLLTPYEAAKLLKVRTTTLARWADTGKIACIKTPSGQRRYYADDVFRIVVERTRGVDDGLSPGFAL